MVTAVATNEEYGYEVLTHQVQTDFLNCDAKVKGFTGGRGAGKSMVGACNLYNNAKPGKLYMIATPDYATIKDATLRSVAELFDRLGKRCKIKLSDFRGEFETRYGGTAELIFKVGDDADKGRGPNLSGIWFDEASLIKREFRLNAIACLRQDPTFNWQAYTFTPKGRHHWTYELFEGDKFPLFRASSFDNPFLPEMFVSELKDQMTSEYAQQEIEGEFIDLAGMLVTPQMLYACTTNDCLSKMTRHACFMGIDVGRTKNPTVITIIERVGDICWLRCLETMHNAPYMLQQATIQELIGQYNPNRIAIDQGTIGHQMAEELQQRYGSYKVQPVTMNRNKMGELAIMMASEMERGRLRLPDDENIRLDFSLIGKPQPLNGKNVLKAEDVHEDKDGRHGDIFWATSYALDLALHTRVQTASRLPSAYTGGIR